MGANLDYEKFLFDFRGASALQVVAYVTPITTNGFLAACLAAFLISRVPAQVIFIVRLCSAVLGYQRD